MTDRGNHNLRGIRFRLLVSVNAVATLGLGVLLFLDYQQEIADQVEVMRVALHEEAKTLVPALKTLAANGPEAIQRHVDQVCARMRESSSPGHHIVVDWRGQTFQTHAHSQGTPIELGAIREAVAAGGIVGGQDGVVVGSDRDGETTVYVSERVSNVLRRVRARALRRAFALAGLIGIAGIIVNLILVRLVVKPVRELAKTVREVGAGNLGAHAPDSKTAELSVLASEINQMSSALLQSERVRHHELQKAREIQEKLCQLPEQLPGMTLARIYLPATEVAGDHFNVLPLANGTWLICIADVIGHGIPAAMGAAVLKTLIEAGAEKLVEPAEILAYVNERFCSVSLPGDFATVALVIWDPENAQLQYAGGGHEAGILRNGEGTITHFGSTGIVLGIDEDAVWATRTVSVSDGAQLLLMTDGVSETRAPDGTLFGTERVAELFDEHAAKPPEDTLALIDRALVHHRDGGHQTDDITLLLARFEQGVEQ